MEQALVRLHLDKPSCPAVGQLSDDQRVRCHVPGGPFGAYAWRGGDAPPGWQTLLSCSGGQFMRLEEADCSTCPLASLPPQTYPVAVEVRPDGLRVDMALPDPEQLRVVLRHWAARGQCPRVVRAALSGEQPDGLALLDLGLLTRRQREALEAATRIGYFEEGGVGVSELATQMGCSRSTAHEHLRKGLDRLVRAAVSA